MVAPVGADPLSGPETAVHGRSSSRHEHRAVTRSPLSGPPRSPLPSSWRPAPRPTPSPGTTATPAPTVRPSPTEVGSPASADCTPADIELAHGRIDGAAGSRFTTLTLTVTGPAACSLPGGPTVELVDAGGAILFTSAAAGASPIDLPPGATATSTIQLANWCTDPPAQPVTLTLVLGSATIDAAAARSLRRTRCHPATAGRRSSSALPPGQCPSRSARAGRSRKAGPRPSRSAGVP